MNTRLAQLLPPLHASPVLSNVRNTLSLEHLFTANLHLGHNTQAWNPNMMPFIYGSRNGIHIINLDHTLVYLKRAINVTREVALRGGNIVFLGSRPMLHKIVVDAALEGKAYYLTKWKGGLITNKERVLRLSVGYDPDKVIQESKSIDLNDEEDNTASTVAKKQPYVHQPDLVIILDYPNNLWALREANFAGVPVIALCDTDCDPQLVQYPIPGNDDSPLGLTLIAGVLSKASREGYDKRQKLIETNSI
jgi:small subunit ribosomal protein S2